MLYRTPAMALNIHTIIQDGDAFRTQSCPLFVPRGAAQWQTDPTAGTQYPVPRQFGIAG